MNKDNHLNLMMEAFTEVVQEEALTNKASPPIHSTRVLPSLWKVLDELSPLPQDALFLGMAYDGLPILLNLSDSVPGPILIMGETNSGKTKLLQHIAKTTDIIFKPEKVQWVVITSKTEEWLTPYPQNDTSKLYNINEENSSELLQSLVTWAHHNKGLDQTIILLIDNISAFSHLEAQAQQNLRWLLLRGASRHVWTFATMDTNLTAEQQEWLSFFHTRLFASIHDDEIAQQLTGGFKLNQLIPKEEFAMREGDNLLKFWLPVLPETT